MATDNQLVALNILVHGYPRLSSAALKGREPQALSVREASEVIGQMITDEKPPRLKGGIWPWTYWTKQTVCAQALFERNGDIDATVADLTPSLGKIKALTFGRNKDGERVPFNLSDPTERAYAIEALRKQVGAVKRDVQKALAEHGEQKQEQRQEQKRDEQKDEQKQEQQKQDTLARKVFDRILAIQAWCKQRSADGHEIDEIGLRPFEYAAKMLRAGISEQAIFHAMTMHYPPEARKALNVEHYDVTKFRQSEQRDGIHAALPYIMALISERIPVALVGPKGTGKSTLAAQIANLLDVPFGMVSMTAATPPSAFNGRPRIADDGTMALVQALIAAGRTDDALLLALKAKENGDTVVSQFQKIYGGGGVFLFDEMDASDENLLLLVNAALANGQFANAATGEIIKRHEDFIPIAGMNTLGLGQGRHYNSRNRLDAATLDRWNMGRVQVQFDKRIAESMFFSIVGENA